jgi:hypothetical protein
MLLLWSRITCSGDADKVGNFDIAHFCTCYITCDFAVCGASFVEPVQVNGDDF